MILHALVSVCTLKATQLIVVWNAVNVPEFCQSQFSIALSERDARASSAFIALLVVDASKRALSMLQHSLSCASVTE